MIIRGYIQLFYARYSACFTNYILSSPLLYPYFALIAILGSRNKKYQTKVDSIIRFGGQHSSPRIIPPYTILWGSQKILPNSHDQTYGRRGYHSTENYGSLFWPTFDHNDSILSNNKDTLYPVFIEDLDSYSRYQKFNKKDQKKIKKQVYGLYSWEFVEDFEIDVNPNLETTFNEVYPKIKKLIESLDDDTIYKWVVIGLIHWEIKSAPSSFFISKKSSAESVAHNFITYTTALQMGYLDVEFTSWRIAHRKWVGKDQLNVSFDALIHLTEVENSKSASFLKNSHQKRHFPVFNSIDWISEHSKNRCAFRAYDRIHIGKYGESLGGGRFSFENLVLHVETRGPLYLITVYKSDNIKVTWVDKPGEGTRWTRIFPNLGIQVLYEDGTYKEAQVIYKTTEWANTKPATQYDDKIGSLDIETFTVSEGFGLAIPYAAGFRKITGHEELFYKEKNEEPSEMLCKMLNRLLQPENDGWLFYVHNLARFDSRFILAALGKMGIKPRKLLGRAINQIFFISISIKVGDKKVTVSLTDSIYILTGSLDNLAKKFGSVNKGVFPYSFVQANNLEYKGEIPPLTYYNNLDPSEYSKLALKYNANNPWSMKDETLRYLSRDLECLINVMSTFNKSIYDKYQVNTTKVRSYSALSKLVYTTKFYKETGVKIPVIAGYIEKIIRKGYYGGLVDVVENIVQKAYKYDANSHYPAAMINDMPVGNPIITDSKDLNNLFGFSHAKVTAPTVDVLQHATLPFRDSRGVTTCPRGTFEGVWFTEELKDSVSRGYQVDIISTVVFERGKGLFTKFIYDLFAAKAKAKEEGDSVGELVYKLLMNSFYGKSGQLEVENTYTMVETTNLEEFGKKHNYDLAQDFDKLTLVRETGEYNPALLALLNPHTPKAKSNKLPDKDKNKGVKSCVAIAAAITAYARITLNRFKNIPDNKYLGGDTDSVIMQKPLPEIFVGKQLGMMKFEDDIAFGLYADKKLYYAVNSKGVENIKSRGVGKNFNRKDILQLPHFLLMLAGHVVTVNKTKFVINKKGAVEIKNVSLQTKIQKRTYQQLLAEMDAYLANHHHPKNNLARYIASLRGLTPSQVKDFVSGNNTDFLPKTREELVEGVYHTEKCEGESHHTNPTHVNITSKSEQSLYVDLRTSIPPPWKTLTLFESILRKVPRHQPLLWEEKAEVTSKESGWSSCFSQFPPGE